MEVLHGDGSPWCTLPHLPEARKRHTQTGLEACGGDSNYSPEITTWSTCVQFQGGSWSPSHNLLQERADHSVWASPAGTVLMGGAGGIFSLNTTELLEEGTGDSVVHFPLKYDTR